MHFKYLLNFIFLLPLIACDTTPKNEQETYSDEGIEKSMRPEEDYATNNNASIMAMADIIKPEDEDFSGKAYFTKKENEFTLTVILNNAETDTYQVYIIREGDCNNINLDKTDLNENSITKNVGSVKVLEDRTGRSEILLKEFPEIQENKILDYNILIAQTDGEIIGCGEIKKYVEEKNLSNAAN